MRWEEREREGGEKKKERAYCHVLNVKLRQFKVRNTPPSYHLRNGVV